MYRKESPAALQKEKSVSCYMSVAITRQKNITRTYS